MVFRAVASWLAAAAAAAAGAAPSAPQVAASDAASVPASAATGSQGCVKSVAGAQFLAASQARGLVPVSDCLHVDLVANRFFAPPATACNVTFASRAWLDSGWEFVRLKGLGGFTSRHEDGALIVTIEAQGGFSATEFTLRSKEPMPSDDCKAAGLGDILK
ncbi:MAG TPA: hypothetical protein VFY73_12300 [Ideonella sp.]|uniref:hypothetical protein n=1 Tax=Ideonella sp. TaxID=1929293 RepID=UPI002E32D45C|nr:hypothetical protein [Ideonella sp.]HEX5684799.1 hypothetical protein [Ideonella sp.]